ncbi:MAG: TniQ family protein [Candidatus Nanopelagicales bacterium]
MTVTPLRTAQPLRTLPVAVHPVPGETFHSWTVRLAARLGVEPLRALHAAGYITSHVRHRADLTGYGITLTDPSVTEMTRTTRASEEVLRGTLLTVFDGGPIRLDEYDPQRRGDTRRIGTREWVHLRTSNACPDCLRTNGNVWQLTWRLPWTPVCLHHQALLLDRCPACGQPFNAGSRRDGSLGPRAANTRPNPALCANPLDQENRSPYPPLCNHSYADMTSETCTQPGVLAAQAQVNVLLEPEHRQTGHEWWLDLRAVTATLLTHGNPDHLASALPGLPDVSRGALTEHFADRDLVDAERAATLAAGRDHRQSSRRRTYLQTPTSTALVAVLLPHALAALHDLQHLPEPLADSGTPMPDLDAADLLADMVQARGHNLTTELRQRGGSPELLERLATRSGYNHLQRTTTTHDGLPTSAIPRLYPWHLYQPVRDILRATGTTDDYARCYLSLCAAKLVSGGTWEQAGEALDWGSRKARGCANAVTTRLNTAGHLDLIHQHVRDTITDLPIDIDYSHLADQYGRVTTIRADQWEQAAAAAGLNLAPTAARRRNLAAWQWHHLALMPLNEWPGWQACANPESAKEVYRRFTREVEATRVRR